MDVDGELLTEGQLHDGPVLSAPKEREGAAQHDSNERGQRVEHGRIVRAAGFEWEPESRAVADVFSGRSNFVFAGSISWGAIVSFARFGDRDDERYLVAHQTPKRARCSTMP